MAHICRRCAFLGQELNVQWSIKQGTNKDNPDNRCARISTLRLVLLKFGHINAAHKEMVSSLRGYSVVRQYIWRLFGRLLDPVRTSAEAVNRVINHLFNGVEVIGFPACAWDLTPYSMLCFSDNDGAHHCVTIGGYCDHCKCFAYYDTSDGGPVKLMTEKLYRRRHLTNCQIWSVRAGTLRDEVVSAIVQEINDPRPPVRPPRRLSG